MRLRRTLVAIVLPVASVLALAGCRTDETIAREMFGGRFTCPEDRITTTTRKDLRAVDVAFRAKPAPSDVAADPARLALWNKEQERAAADFASLTVVEVKGCERDLLFACGDLRVTVGSTRHSCMDAPYAPR